MMQGTQKVRNQIEAFASQFPKRVGRALFLEAQIEMTESKRRCPVDVTPPTPHPGLLRSTGKVWEPAIGPDGKIYVLLTYGTDYAIYVHENLDAFHPIGQAKFLESVLDESAPYMSTRLAARLKPMLHEL